MVQIKNILRMMKEKSKNKSESEEGLSLIDISKIYVVKCS